MKKGRRRTSSVPPSSGHSKSWQVVWLVGLLFVATLPVTLFRINNPDIWWHLVCGREMLRTGAAPVISKFYFTPVASSVEDFRYTFLGDILLAMVNAVGGVVALQFLVILCAAALLLCLWRIGRVPWSAWLVLLLTVTVFGVGQLLLVRNSLFGLPLTGVLLWLAARAQFGGDRRSLYALPLVLGTWGMVHGSYLLGFVVLVLLGLGGWIDRLRKLPRSHFVLLPWLAVLGVSFALISIGNPTTARFLKIPFNQIAAFKTRRQPVQDAANTDNGSPASFLEGAAKLGGANPAQDVSGKSAADGWLVRVKKGLNTMIWSFGENEVQSGDFRSPFDRLGYLPVIASFALGIVAVISAAFFIRPLRCTVWLPFAAVLVHGTGYVRSVGFIAIFAAWALLVSTRLQDWRAPWWASISAWGRRLAIGLTAGMGMVLFVAARRGELGQAVGQSDHIFGFGVIPSFDDAMCRYVLEHFEKEPVFTTILSGSYALEEWRLRKPVFIDAFFAAHPRALWADYAALRKGGDPDLLYSNYGANLVLVENSRSDWNLLFLKSAHWLPCAVGKGLTLYRYNDRGPLSFAPPEILFTLDDVAALPDPLLRHRAMAQFYNCIMSLHAKGRAVPALELRHRFEGLFRNGRGYLVPWEQTKVDVTGVGMGREYILTR